MIVVIFRGIVSVNRACYNIVEASTELMNKYNILYSNHVDNSLLYFISTCLIKPLENHLAYLYKADVL